jgi:hypothetical protein
LARAVLIIEPSAIFVAVTESTSEVTAISNRNFPYLVSPICKNGRSSETLM